MCKKAVFIFNPFSGKESIKNKLFEIINTLSLAGYHTTVYPTKKTMDGYHFIVNYAKDYDLLIISGGDGTLNEGVRGLLQIEEEKRPKFGYVPAGSTNDFASSLGIPKKPLDALRYLLDGTECTYDVGKFLDTNFVYVAAFGAFTDVAYDTPQQIKNQLGHIAYVLEGIMKIPTITAQVMEIEHDGTIERGSYIFGMVSNSNVVGGFKSYKKNVVSLNDGVFECVLVRAPENPIELQTIIAGLLKQDFSSSSFYTFKAKKITITSTEEVRWTLDGEFGGQHQEVKIENLHKALKILVGEKLVTSI